MTAEMKETKKPIKFPIKSLPPLRGKVDNPMDIEFPTLEDLEMDVPLINEHMEQFRIAPEDESTFEVDCLECFTPSLVSTSLAL